MRSPLFIFFLFALMGMVPEARSQYVGGGSTPQGDYLRGLGIAASGLGSFNRDTAVANSINADTSIRLDDYIRRVTTQDRAYSARIDRDRREKHKANHEAIRRRIREHPEQLDLMTGKALNDVLGQLNDPAIHESSFRSAPVTLPVAMIRRIPFSLDEKGVVFSMRRLTAKGKGKWPVAFQGDRFAPERKEFERAIEEALEHMIDKNMPIEVIKAYEAAVWGLTNKLEREYGRSTDRPYQEVKDRIREMEKATLLLKTHKIQPVMADLDRYAGTTVNDLRLFMNAHNLRFALAESADERQMYPELHAALVQVRDLVTDQGKAGANP